MIASSATRETTKNPAQPRQTARLAGLLLLYKIAFFALIWGLTVLAPSSYRMVGYQLHSRGSATSRALPLPTEGLWRHFETWDAHHYLHLARFGYGDQPMSLAFYPLWPFLIRLVAPLFGGNFTLAALALANAFSLVALVLLHRLVARRFDTTIANRTLLLVLAFPGALFLCFAYTEPLFLLLCVALFSLLHSAASDNASPDNASSDNASPDNASSDNAKTECAKTEDWRIVGGVAVCAAAAAFARPTGLFLVVPLAYFAWRRRDNPVWCVVALAPILGFLGYFATIFLATGDAMAGIKAQQLFVAKPSIGKLFDVPGFVRGFLIVGPIKDGYSYIHDRVWFVLFCCTLWPLWRRDKLWFAFAIVMGITTAFGASMMSFMRYFSIIFPCFTTMALWINGRFTRLIFPVLLAILFLLQLRLLLLHINYYWVS